MKPAQSYPRYVTQSSNLIIYCDSLKLPANYSNYIPERNSNFIKVEFEGLNECLPDMVCIKRGLIESGLAVNFFAVIFYLNIMKEIVFLD
jgi:hypothetical protein